MAGSHGLTLLILILYAFLRQLFYFILLSRFTLWKATISTKANKIH